MKILIVSQYYYPEQFLINEIAEELVRLGNRVTVLTGLPNYPSGVISDEYKFFRKRHEIINGVEVIRSFEIPRGKPTLINLMFNYLSFMIAASVKSISLKKYDVVLSYQVTPVTQILPAIIYSKIHKKKLLVYCMDLFPYSFEHWTGSDSILYKIVRLVSRWMYKRADVLAVSSNSFTDYMNSVNKISRKKITYLPQHAADTMLSLNLEAEDNGVSDFMFAGNIGRGQNIETIIEAVEIIKNYSNFKVHLVGDGNNLNNLKQIIKDKGLNDYFVFHGRFKMSEMPDVYKIADALLITLRPGQLTIPSKLQTYMTTGKPVFGAIDGSAQEVIRESQCGVCVPSGDAKGLAKAMADYIENPQKYARCGTEAKRYFSRNFKKDIFMNKLLKLLNNLAD